MKKVHNAVVLELSGECLRVYIICRDSENREMLEAIADAVRDLGKEREEWITLN